MKGQRTPERCEAAGTRPGGRDYFFKNASIRSSARKMFSSELA